MAFIYKFSLSLQKYLLTFKCIQTSPFSRPLLSLYTSQQNINEYKKKKIFRNYTDGILTFVPFVVAFSS